MTVIRSPISPVIFSPLRAPTALYKGGGEDNRIVAYGDSTAAGDGATGDERWWVLLGRQILPARVTESEGIGGNTTTQMLAVVEADNTHARWITIFMDRPNSGETSATWLANVKSAAAARRTDRWFVVPPVVNSPGAGGDSSGAAISEIQAALLSDPAFDGHTFTSDEQAAYLSELDDDDLRETPGYVHFNAAGQYVQARRIRNAFERLGWVDSPLGYLFGGVDGFLHGADVSLLFQDTAATTAADDAGELIGRANDRSGNGRNATQSTYALRPALQFEVGRPVFRAASAGPYLDTPFTYGAGVNVIGCKFTANANGGLMGLISNSRFGLTINASGYLTLQYGSSSSLIVGNTDLRGQPGPYTAIAVIDGSNASLYLDGDLVGTAALVGAHSTAQPVPFGACRHGLVGSISAIHTGDIYMAIAARRAPDAAWAAAVHDWMLAN